MNEPSIRLFSNGLLSKWGFNDGDEPDAFLDYCDEHGINWMLIEWHPVLIKLVRTYLLPALDQQVEVTEISTIHNPIRAEKIDGVDVTGYWHAAEDPPGVLTPESVDVPYSEVVRALPSAARAARPAAADARPGTPAPRTPGR